MASQDRFRLFDSLYGEVVLSPELTSLARTPAVQRLRHIRLSNIDSFNLPGIANVSRFEHVVGTAVLAGETGLLLRLGEDDRLTFQAAAMLHDAAIAPFGHLVEEALAYVNIEFDHETKWLSVIEDPGPSDFGGAEMPIFLGRVSGLRRWANAVFGSASTARERLRMIFEAASGHGRWGQTIAGTLDIDNLDNLSRLAHHIGMDADRGLPVRLARAIVAVFEDGSPVFAAEAEQDIRTWSTLRERVYERLMLGRDDLAAKIMLLCAVSEAVGSGDLEENAYIWTLTDQQLIERLIASGRPTIQRTVADWMVGHLWQIGEPLWFRGPCPQFRQLVDFDAVISSALGRHCFSYRIKDKRHRRLRLPLTSGHWLSVSQDPDTWLLAVGSRLARAFTLADTRRIADLAGDHFGVSRVAEGSRRSQDVVPLFDNAT